MVNTYRVDYAISILLNEHRPNNFREIYLRCGFLSKSTFYSAFTKVMGVPPLQFLHEARRSGKRAEYYSPVKSKNAILSSLSSAFETEAGLINNHAS